MGGQRETTIEPIRRALAACRRHATSVALFSAIINILFLAPTIYMLQIYDRAVPTQSMTTLAFLTVLVVFALAMMAVLDQLRARLLTRAGVRLDRELSPLILGAALRGSASPQSRQAMREFDSLRQLVSGPAFSAMCDLPWTPIYVFVCFLVHPWVGALALFGLVLLPSLIWLHEKAAGPQLQEAQEVAAKSYVAQDQMLAERDAVRALGMGPAMIERQLRLRDGMLERQTRASFSAGRYGGYSRFARMSLQSLGLGLGAWLAIHQEISAGAIFASTFLISRALAPVEQLLGAWRGISQARAGYRSIVELLKSDAIAEERTALPAPVGAVQVEKVGLQLGAEGPTILEDIGFSLGAGQALGVVGPSGAGKTSLLRLIAGIGVPTSGTVRFDGADRQDWDADLLARHVGLLPQDPSLFAGTIKENISRFDGALGGDPEAIDAAAVQAAQRAGAHDFILRLPGGYDYPLAARGGNVSSGQAQRIALARALYGAPSILLLDEPNAHLDTEGDASLLAALQKLKQEGVTIILVSHRLSVLPVIDAMLVLNGGKVHMFGPRDEVLPKITAPNVRQVHPQQQAQS